MATSISTLLTVHPHSTSETTVLGRSSSSSSLSPISTSSVPSFTTIPPAITTTSVSYTNITTYPVSCDATRSGIPLCASSCLSSAAVTQARCRANDAICQCQNQEVIQGAGANCIIGGCGFGGAIDVLNSISACTFSFLFVRFIFSQASDLLLFYSQWPLSSFWQLSLMLCCLQSALASNRGCILQQLQHSLRHWLQLHQRHPF